MGGQIRIAQPVLIPDVIGAAGMLIDRFNRFVFHQETSCIPELSYSTRNLYFATLYSGINGIMMGTVRTNSQ